MSEFVQTLGGPIPKNIYEGIKNYIEERLPPGHFVSAVLENNLSEAVAYADPTSLAYLKPIVQFVFNDLPSPAWGSRSIVRDWLEAENDGTLITGTLEPLG